MYQVDQSAYWQAQLMNWGPKVLIAILIFQNQPPQSPPPPADGTGSPPPASSSPTWPRSPGT